MESSPIQITNATSKRIWYRVSNKGSWEGFDLGSGETQSVSSGFERTAGFLWEKTDPEVWAPTFDNPIHPLGVKFTGIFGPRVSSSIKVLVACLAGPADPKQRNDLEFTQKFVENGVPPENICLLLENQCTPKTIPVMIENTLTYTDPGDIFVLYLGGHGSKVNEEYNLCTYGGYTPSSVVLEALKNCNCELFIIVDSCYSGAFIEDFKKTQLKNVSILSSTDAYSVAQSGWRLVQQLIDKIFGTDFPSVKPVIEKITEDFRTPLEDQRARAYFA